MLVISVERRDENRRIEEGLQRSAPRLSRLRRSRLSRSTRSVSAAMSFLPVRNTHNPRSLRKGAEVRTGRSVTRSPSDSSSSVSPASRFNSSRRFVESHGGIHGGSQKWVEPFHKWHFPNPSYTMALALTINLSDEVSPRMGSYFTRTVLSASIVTVLVIGVPDRGVILTS